MENEKITEIYSIYINNVNTRLEDIRKRKLKQEIKEDIEKLKEEVFDNDTIEFATTLLKYHIFYTRPYFFNLFYNVNNEKIKFDKNQAIEKLNTTREEFFKVFETYAITDAEGKYFNGLFEFKDGLLTVKSIAYIYRLEDINILDEEKDGKVYFLRASLVKSGEKYFLKKGELKYGFNPFLVIVRKNRQKPKKVEKLISKYIEEEKDYAIKYLNTDIVVKNTYNDFDTEIYIIDKRT